MTGDEIVPVLSWVGLAVWIGSLVLFVKHRGGAAAALQAVVALPFLVAPLITLLKWRIDPASYVRQYGTGALGELRGDGIALGLSLLALVACGLAIRGHRFWLIFPLSLNGSVWCSCSTLPTPFVSSERSYQI